jgi:hypothetical protein
MTPRYLVLALLVGVSTSANPVRAAASPQLQLPCKPGYSYVCDGAMICQCVAAEGPTVNEPGSLIWTIMDSHVVGKDETYEFTASLPPPFDASYACQTDLTVEVYDFQGQLLLTQSASLSAAAPSFVLEEPVAPDRGQLRNGLRVHASGKATGCTIEEFLGFQATSGMYETETGKTLSQTAVPLRYTPVLRNNTLPPIYPPYVFPPGMLNPPGLVKYRE